MYGSYGPPPAYKDSMHGMWGLPLSLSVLGLYKLLHHVLGYFIFVPSLTAFLHQQTVAVSSAVVCRCVPHRRPQLSPMNNSLVSIYCIGRVFTWAHKPQTILVVCTLLYLVLSFAWKLQNAFLLTLNGYIFNFSLVQSILNRQLNKCEYPTEYLHTYPRLLLCSRLTGVARTLFLKC